MVYGLSETKISIPNLGNHLLELIREYGNTYWRNKIKADHSPNIHLAVMVEPYLSLVLEGEKTIESRYSINMIPPFNKVRKGDIVILKKSGGDVEAVFEAGEIRCFYLNCKQDLLSIKEKYNDRLLIDDEFWEEKRDAKYATLVDIDSLLPLPKFRINKTSRAGWVTIDTIERKGALNGH
jgi:ASC-1-like (ASCH) protein